jgi:hypothetical protein
MASSMCILYIMPSMLMPVPNALVATIQPPIRFYSSNASALPLVVAL